MKSRTLTDPQRLGLGELRDGGLDYWQWRVRVASRRAVGRRPRWRDEWIGIFLNRELVTVDSNGVYRLTPAGQAAIEGAS